jgi:hypothetical protein
MIVFPEKNKPILVVDNIKILYAKVEKDRDGWISFSMYCPILFDLVEISTTDKLKFKAWFNGKIWEGLRIKTQPSVVKWRRIKER